MFKTVSTDCNLDCAYCYYRESLEGTRVRRRIDPRLLETFIPQYMAYVADARAASFAWQGGEPTLAGLPFFERVVALQAHHARPGTTIANALQTNGLLLDDEWGAFLKRYNFLVGISLDGPQPIHDQQRRAKSGRGSFDLVMRGIDVLRRHGIDFNVLCVLGPHNVGHPGELMAFYREQGFTHVQFIPCMDFQAMEPEKPPVFQVTREEYGAFLTSAFDEWHQDGQPSLSIRTFDNFLQSYVGVPNDLCVHDDKCDAGIVVEYNGDAYPCDFYIHPRWKLGNVVEQPLREVLYSPIRAAFIRQKRPLPSACQECEWLAVCKSGCPRNRAEDGGGQVPDYFCASYMQLFSHADARLRELTSHVQRRQRYLHQLRLEPKLADRKGDVCPCGSGKKQRHCCGAPDAARSYVFRV
ncbi:MAG: anaerobic sulfatase maturase [Chloroflexota bacterium]|nr:MAG: anaerobic sulfatase maturase [Chloroflexota bacterium]